MAKAKAATEDKPESHVVIPDAQSAALVEVAPTKDDIQEGTVNSDLVAGPESAIGDGAKVSPVVELVTKRLKATSKKIVSIIILPSTRGTKRILTLQTRIATYSTTDPEKLNDDQIRSLKGLPALEAVQKELSEVKKAIEVFEFTNHLSPQLTGLVAP